MSEKLYGVDQFYPGDFAQILTGVYNYNTKRLHSSLNCMTPEEFESKILNEDFGMK